MRVSLNIISRMFRKNTSKAFHLSVYLRNCKYMSGNDGLIGWAIIIIFLFICRFVISVNYAG